MARRGVLPVLPRGARPAALPDLHGDAHEPPPPAPAARGQTGDPHGTVRDRLTRSARRGGFLALTVKVHRLPGAAEHGQDWQTVLRADAASSPGRVKPGLATFVRAVWQRVEEHLTARCAASRTALFLHDAGLVARYWDEGGRILLVRLQSAARRPAQDPHGLWLLCPVEARIQVPHLNGRIVEAVPGDGELAYLDGAFLSSQASA
ncbi:hypothetical protein [Streptomyces pini]|uniref:Uncharacterized protein n=1 Tax=Streptomyces pini TaxID=1520580 RepID=A0A1I3Z5H9_9ACTN|nr:hypothetical protein [Streptomyces pini]SFK38816.1 hypothetical protein SAMN05192584_105315 [Streptomyces pini]